MLAMDKRSAVHRVPVTRLRRPLFLRWLLPVAIAAGISVPCVGEAPIVVDGSTKTNLTVNGNVTSITTATVQGKNAFNSFKSFNVLSGQRVDLHTPATADNLVNLVTGGELSRIDGTLNMLKQGQIGGNVFLVNPSGLVVGSSGLINASQLTIMAPTQSTVTNFFDSQGTADAEKLGSILAGTATVNSDATVDVQGRINTTESLSVMAGKINVAGQIRAGKAVDVQQLVNTAGIDPAQTVVKRDGRVFLSADSGDLTVAGQVTTTDSAQDAAGVISLRGQGNTTIASGATVEAGKEGSIELDSGSDLKIEGTVAAGSETSDTTGSIRMTSQGSTSIAGQVLGDTTVQALRDFEVTGTIRAPGATQGSRGGSVLLYGSLAGKIDGGTIDVNARGTTAAGGQINLITGQSALTLNNATLHATGPQAGRILVNVPELVTTGTNYFDLVLTQQTRQDILTIDGSNLTSGLDFIAVANKKIIVSSGATVDTRLFDNSGNTTGNSGTVFFQAGVIDIGSGSSILTDGGTSYLGGDITMIATANSKDYAGAACLHVGDNALLSAGSGTVSLLNYAVNPNVAAWFYQNYAANIQIDKARIYGNVVDITALASSTSKLDLTFSSEHQPGSEPYMTDFQISEGPGLSLFAAGTFAWTDAQVILDGCDIQAGQLLNIAAESFSSAQNQAVGLLAAATASLSDAKATTHIKSGTTLASEGTLNVTSKAKSQAVTTALGLNSSSGQGLAIAALVGNAEAQTTIDTGATLQGLVTNVGADAMGIYVASSSTIPLSATNIPASGALVINTNSTTARTDVSGTVKGDESATIASNAITGASQAKAAAPSFNGNQGVPAIKGAYDQIKRWLTGKCPSSIGSDGKALFANGAAAISILLSKTTAETVLGKGGTLESSNGPATMLAVTYNPSTGAALGSAGAGEYSVGGALNLVEVTAQARSRVDDGATVTGAGGVNVLAQTLSPTSLKYSSWWQSLKMMFEGTISDSPTDFAEGYDAGRRFLVNGFNAVMTLFGPLMSGDLALSDMVFTTYSQASERTDAKSGKVGIAAAINVFTRNNTAEASIGRGAIVNGGTDPQGAVVVQAKIDNFSTDMSGIWSAGSLVTGGTVGGKGNSAGGSGQVVTVNNKAYAWIDDMAQVTGPAVIVQSHVINNNVSLAESGVNTSELGFSGAFNYRSITNDVQSWIEDTAKVNAAAIVQVLAGVENYGLTIAGGWLEGTTKGVGLSGAVSTYNNTTAAFIGNKNANPAGATEGQVTCQDGAVRVEADSTNRIVTLAVAGNSKWGPAGLSGAADLKVPETPSEAGEVSSSKFGLGISGDAAVTVVNDDTKAYVSGVKITSKALQIAAKNSLGAFQGTGTLVANSGNGLAGSFSYLQGDRSAKAWLDTATVNTGELTINADFDDSYALGSAGLGVSTSNNAVAGSVNVLNMTQKAWAWIGNNARITTTGDVLLDAHAKNNVVSVAGQAAVGKQAGIGAVVDLGFLNTDLLAGVFATPDTNQQSLSWLPTDQNDFSVTGTTVNAGGSFAATTRYNGLLIAPVACAAASDKLSIRGTGQVWTLNQRLLSAIANGATIGSSQSTGNTALATFSDQVAVLASGNIGASSGSGFGGSVSVLNINRSSLARLGSNALVYVHGAGSSLVKIDTGKKDSEGKEIEQEYEEGLAVESDATDRIYAVTVGGQGGGKAQVAAGVLAVNQKAVTGAEIGSGAVVRQTTDAQGNANVSDGQGVHVTARDNVVALAGNGQVVLGGTQAPAVGAVVNTMTLNRDTHATVGDRAVVTGKQDLKVTADSVERLYSVTAAAGGGLSTGISGAANVNVVTSKTHALVGDDAKLTATDGNVQIRAVNDRQLTSAAAGLSGSGKTGLGDAANVNVLTTDTVASIGDRATVDAGGTSDASLDVYTGQLKADGTLETTKLHGLDLSAVNTQSLVAATVGGSAGKGIQVQPTVSVAINTAKAEATVGEAATINSKATQTQQDLAIRAFNLNDMGLYTIGAGAGQASVSPAINILSNTKTTNAAIGNNSSVKAGGNIDVSVLNADRLNAVAAGGSAGQTAGVAATVSVANVADTTHATVGTNVDLQAGKSITVAAGDQTTIGKQLELKTGETTVSYAGSQANEAQTVLVWPDFSSEGAWPEIAAQNGLKATGLDWVALPGPTCGIVSIALGVGGQVGTGATVAATVINKDTRAQVLGQHQNGRSMTAGGYVTVAAESEETLDSWTAAGAGGGTVGVAGAVNVRVINPTVVASLGDGTLVNPTTGATQGNDVRILASDTLKSTGLTGALSVAGKVGATAVADVLVARPNITSSIGSGSTVLTPKDVLVQATGTNQLHAFAIGGGLSTAVGVAPSVAVSVLNGALTSEAAQMLNGSATGNHVDSAMQQNWLAGQVVLPSATAKQIEQHLAALNTGKTLNPDAAFTAGGTNALISSDVTLTGRNLTLQSQSVLDRLTVAGGLGAGLYAGVAGGVAVDSSSLSAHSLLGRAKVTMSGQTAVKSLVDRKAVTVAVAGAGGVGSAAGALAINDMTDEGKSEIASGTEINKDTTAPGESVQVLAQRDANVTSVTALGQVAGAGAGVSVNTSVLNGTTTARVSDGSTIRAAKSITLDALASDTLTTAGGAVGVGGATGVLVSGAVNSLNGNTAVEVVSGSTLSTDGSMRLNALHDTTLTSLVGAVGTSAGAMAVPTVAVNVINKNTRVLIGKRVTLHAAGTAGTVSGVPTGFTDHGDYWLLHNYSIDRTYQEFAGLAVTASNIENIFSDTFGLTAALAAAAAATVNTTTLNTTTSVQTEPFAKLSGANVLLNSLGFTRLFGGAQTGSVAGTAGMSAATSVDVVKRLFETTLGDETVISEVPGSVQIGSSGWFNGATLAAASSASGGAQATGAIGVQTVDNTAKTNLGPSVVIESSGTVSVESLAQTTLRGHVGQGSISGMAGIGGGIYVPHATTQALTTTDSNVRISDKDSKRSKSIQLESEAKTNVDGLAVSGTAGGFGYSAAGGVVASSVTTRANTLLGDSNTLKGDQVVLKAEGTAEQTLRAGGGSAAFAGAAGAGVGVANSTIDVRANGGTNLTAEAEGIEITATGRQLADVVTAAGAAAGVAVTGAVSVAHLGGSHDTRTSASVADIASAARTGVDRAKASLNALPTSGTAATAAKTAQTQVGTVQADTGLTGATAGTIAAQLGTGSHVTTGQNGLTIRATSAASTELKAGAGDLGVVGMGGAVSAGTIDGTVLADVGDHSTISTSGGNVTIEASQGPWDSAHTSRAAAYAEGGGLVSIGAAVATLNQSVNVLSHTGSGVTINAPNAALRIAALNNTQGTTYVHGLKVGGATVSASIAENNVSGNTKAEANSENVTAGTATIVAEHDVTLKGESYASAGGVASGAGTSSTVNVTPTVRTTACAKWNVDTFRMTPSLILNGDFKVYGTSNGGLAVGVGRTVVNVTPRIESILYGNSVVNASKAFENTATYQDHLTTYAGASTGSLVGGIGAASDVTIKPTVATTIQKGAKISGGDVTVRNSVQSDVSAKSTCVVASGVIAAGRIDNRVEMTPDLTLAIEPNANISGSNVTLESLVGGAVKMHSHGAGGGFAGGINCAPTIIYKPTNTIRLLSDNTASHNGGGSIRATGNLSVLNRSDFTAQDFYALVDFGGFGTGTGVEALLETSATNLIVLGKTSKLTSLGDMTLFSQASTTANNVQTTTNNGAAAGAAIAWFRWKGGDCQDIIFSDSSSATAGNNLHTQIWTGKRGKLVTRATMGAGASRTEAHTIVEDAGGHSTILLANGAHLRANNQLIVYNLFNPYLTAESHAVAGGAMLFGIGEAVMTLNPQLMIRLADNSRLEGNQVVMRASLNDRWGTVQQSPTLNVTGDYTGTTAISPFCFGNGKAEARLLGQWIISMAPSSVIQYASTADIGVGGFTSTINSWQEKIWNGVHYGSHGVAEFRNGAAMTSGAHIVHAPLASVAAANADSDVAASDDSDVDPLSSEPTLDLTGFPGDLSCLADLAAIYEYYQDHPEWVTAGLRTVLAELLLEAADQMSDAERNRWRYDAAALLAYLVPDRTRLALEQDTPVTADVTPLLQSLSKTLNRMVEDPRNLNPQAPEGKLLWEALYGLLRLDPHQDPVAAAEIQDVVWFFEVFYGPVTKETLVTPPQTEQLRHTATPTDEDELIDMDDLSAIDAPSDLELSLQ